MARPGRLSSAECRTGRALHNRGNEGFLRESEGGGSIVGGNGGVCVHSPLKIRNIGNVVLNKDLLTSIEETNTSFDSAASDQESGFFPSNLQKRKRELTSYKQ